MIFGISQRETRALLVLAEELHFGRAAEKLRLAQPQLSHLIKRIEQAVGFDIFTRRPSVRLTAAGATFIAGARRAEANLRLSVEEGRAIAAGRKGSVRIGFSDAAMLTKLPTVLQRFSKTVPDVALQLVEGTTVNLLHQLRQGALDLAITRQQADDPSLTSVRVVDDELVLAVPEGHWASARETIRLADFSNEYVVIFSRTAAPKYHDSVLRASYAAGFAPAALQEVDSRAATMALVAAGFGIAFATAVSQRTGHPGVVFCKIADPMPDVSFWASYNPDRLGAPATAAVEYIRQALIVSE